MANQWFTPRSARLLIPRIKPVAERICRLYRCLESRRPRRIKSDARVDPTYFRLLLELIDALDPQVRDKIYADNARALIPSLPAR